MQSSWHFSRGHVGSLIKYVRSQQENLRAHNDKEFIFKSKTAETVKMQITNCSWIFLHNATRNFYCVKIFCCPYFKLMHMITWISFLHCSYYTCVSNFQIINANIFIYPWIPVAKWATSFLFLVVHRQHLVALASGQPVICNPEKDLNFCSRTSIALKILQVLWKLAF